MKQIQTIYNRFEKRIHLVLAIQLLFAIGLNALPIASVNAAQLTGKSIQMSDSGPSGAGITSGTGSGTNVAYKVTFSTTSTSTAIAGIVIDFCSNTPISGDNCSAPTGFNINRGSTTAYNQTGLGTGSFSVVTTDSPNPNNNRIILTRGTAANPTATGSIELGNGTSNGFTNPSTTGGFFARIYTYAANGNSSTAGTTLGHVSDGPSGFVDNGGVALSTANVIRITARVQESIIFCVFGGAAPNSNCAASGSSTSPALEVGHVPAGGSKKIIDSSAVDTINAFMQLSTNAGTGATVRMHSSSATGGLDSGSNSIPPVNGGSNATGSITAGNAAFGLFVAASTGGTGTVTPDGNYNTSGSGYGMDSTTTGNNVTSTYGDTIAASSAPVSNVNNTLTFAATASNVTPAGLYSANLALVATGVF